MLDTNTSVGALLRPGIEVATLQVSGRLMIASRTTGCSLEYRLWPCWRPRIIETPEESMLAV